MKSTKRPTTKPRKVVQQGTGLPEDLAGTYSRRGKRFLGLLAEAETPDGLRVRLEKVKKPNEPPVFVLTVGDEVYQQWKQEFEDQAIALFQRTVALGHRPHNGCLLPRQTDR